MGVRPARIAQDCSHFLACLLGALLIGLAGSLHAQPAQGSLRLGTGTEEHEYNGIWLRRLYAEAARRLGLQLQVVIAPAKRATVMTERGELDGEMIRARAYAEAHPEMLMIDVPLVTTVFAIYARDGASKANSLAELRQTSGQVVFRRGVQVCEDALRAALPAERIAEVVSAENALKMLERGHARYLCDMDSAVNAVRSRVGETLLGSRLFSVGDATQLYPFLSARHTSLAPRLTATLKSMRAEGLIERYQADALRQLNSSAP
ncbi:transporter substrate-binding domain-containing protein [Paucibacter sp. APW11]|uniref:Transporter substrate-binding domain-containing protein n=1 Tax=Roseateles aquae TaxID=3077235 RepID=A0ABU3PDH9_9BURK|nr:transporter substrate-binding domain-containing protein [Paucibacter sp. APW11]MDT9000588.1 transporter substrate-binding domain-containing protein [Paucibacter sp. APW11]